MTGSKEYTYHIRSTLRYDLVHEMTWLRLVIGYNDVGFHSPETFLLLEIPLEEFTAFTRLDGGDSPRAGCDQLTMVCDERGRLDVMLCGPPLLPKK